MAVFPGVRALMSLHRSLALQCHFTQLLAQQISTCLPRGLCTITPNPNKPKPQVGSENDSLLENLNLMGVDVRMVRQRQPGVLRRAFTNEQGLETFLQSKGASSAAIASIISRYPRAITRSVDHLEQRWVLWRSIFKSDQEIVSILARSPESFFRSSDNDNLEKNILFLTSLGLSSKDLHRLLTTAPRTFSNSVALNKQMVEFLEDICTELGGEDPQQFAKTVISKNLYILIRSTKRVKANIDSLKSSLRLSDSDLLALLQGPGAEILDLSSEYLKKNVKSLQEKMVSLGCRKSEIKKLIVTYPMVLFIGPATLSPKFDCLIKGGITMKQIMEKPRVLQYSTHNLTERLEELKRVGYNFKMNSITILDSSRKRFDAKLDKLAVSSPDE